MKYFHTYLSFLLGLLIVLGISWQSAVIVDFYAHQDEIEAEFCVNKNKPELSCKGKCHLQKQLTVSKKVDEPQEQFRTSMLVFQAFQAVEQITFGPFDLDSFGPHFYHFSIKEHDLSVSKSPPEIS